MVIPGGGVVEGGEAAAAMQAEVGADARRARPRARGSELHGCHRPPRGEQRELHRRRVALPATWRGCGHRPVRARSATRSSIRGNRIGFSRIISCGSEVVLDICDDAAADQFVATLRDQLGAGRTKLILDLRGNPGGYVTAARKIASQFVGSGVVFWEQDAAGNQVPTNALTDGVATDPAVQVVVLIDGGTASASEIVAGALQDDERATLVGQQSYGKGTVQQWQELTGDAGAFKLTIARWLTPDKRWIHKVGLTPDVIVTLPSPPPLGADPDLDKALEVLGATGEGSLELAAA